MTDPLISVHELTAALAALGPAPHLFDASYVLHPPRFDGDYRSEPARQLWLAEHIPGSRYVDVSSQFSDRSSPFHYRHPSAQAVADELARLGVAQDDPVVIYDSVGGLWSARLWYLLDWIGVPARVLDGGLAAWRRAGRPITSGETPPRPPTPSWVARPARDPWVTKDELLRRSVADAPLVCGLSAGLFEGSETTRYARRGRIPDSVNLSARGLVDEHGLIRSRAELVAAHEAAGVPLDGSPVLLYCGGGISVSGSALVLAHLGVRDVRIYDNSLEEWAADPDLPLDVGPLRDDPSPDRGIMER